MHEVFIILKVLLYIVFSKIYEQKHTETQFGSNFDSSPLTSTLPILYSYVVMLVMTSVNKFENMKIIEVNTVIA